MEDGLNFKDLVGDLSQTLADKEVELEARDEFVHESYDALKLRRVFSAQVPADLGGGDISHSQMAGFLRSLAQSCPSTALALSMHQHLVSAARKNHQDGKPGQALLEKVAKNELVLVSTGANDWLSSNGKATKVEGGYEIEAVKPFASGSPRGAVAITSCAYDCPEDGPSVIHFPLPLNSQGVEFLDDWEAMGMRSTGSQTLKFNKVFVPDEAIALKRPRGPYHPAFSVIVTVAMPLIMSVYTGIAEAAVEKARELAKPGANDPVTQFLVGEMENLLTTAQMSVDSMVALADDLNFTPSESLASDILKRKTICAKAVIATVEKAVEVAGGRGFLRKTGLERLLRDVHGSQFHPLTEKKQLQFTGRLTLGLDPVDAG